tara:strand:- start:1818 stop:2705 length:888 start_codon:yes stop_codon:yes gene_type:complete
MKAVMYHYVRNYQKEFPFYNFLPKKNFEKQIKNFSNKGLISTYREIFEINDKYLVTFDDGLKDHIYAAEILKKKNCVGIFFIPTTPIKKKKILDVHKTHLIVGKMSGKETIEELERLINKNKIKNYFNYKEKEKYIDAYHNRGDEFYKKEFKKIMNYYGNLKLRSKILNELIKIFEIKVSYKDYYMNKKELKYLLNLGMIIGSHSENHILLSRLSYNQQFKDIKNSKNYLENILNEEINTFCYPYGGKISYNYDTLKILKLLKFKIAFSVENREINRKDFKNKPFELPRFDCNQF